MRKKLVKTTSFIFASVNLEINLTEKMKNLYNENYNKLKKEIEKDKKIKALVLVDW